MSLPTILQTSSTIEPFISHAKHKHGLGKQIMLGRVRDDFYALLSTCGFNSIKRLRFITRSSPATGTESSESEGPYFWGD